MRIALRLLAMISFLGPAVWWAADGAHPGWSKNTVAVHTLDEITGIEQITYEKRFVPGIDTLAFGLVVAVGLSGLSALIGRRLR